MLTRNNCKNIFLIIYGFIIELILLENTVNGNINSKLLFIEPPELYIIFPGTKWCGPGNNANGYDDLGKFRETDICCRDHDNCDSIPPYEEKHGLVNDYRYTRLHCKCDKNFYDCLHKVNDNVSNTVGKTYFQFSNGCYREDYPTTGCLETEQSLFDKRCTKYSYDKDKTKKYQWFDLPYYNSEKFPDINRS